MGILTAAILLLSEVMIVGGENEVLQLGRTFRSLVRKSVISPTGTHMQNDDVGT